MTKTITNFNIPRNVKELRSFLGLTLFYSRFNSKYSQECVPLYELCKKPNKFKWSQESNEQFIKVKNLFIESVILHYPDFNLPFYVQCDASKLAVAGQLYQIINGEMRVLQFASRKLTKCEQAYTIMEMEMLGIVVLVKKWFNYITSSKFTTIVYTDHKALESMFKIVNPTNRVCRWLAFLQLVDIKVEYIKGKLNVVADCLSRHPPNDSEEEPTTTVIEKADGYPIFVISESCQAISTMLNDIIVLQESDPYIQGIKNKVDLPDSRFFLRDDVYYVRQDEGVKLILPKASVAEVIINIHAEYHHPGCYKTRRIIQEDFYFPNLKKIVKNTLKYCDVCQRKKISTTAYHQKNCTLIPQSLDHYVCVDFCGPFPPSSRRKYQYLFIVVNPFSKFMKAYPVTVETAQVAIKCMDLYIQQFGKMKTVLCDNGRQFTSKKWLQYLEQNNIKAVFVPIRHPASNRAERSIRDIMEKLRICLNGHHEQWSYHITDLEFSLNATECVTTQMTPIEAQFGIKPMRPWENHPYLKYVRETHQVLQNAEEVIQDRIKTCRNYQNEKTDHNRIIREFNVGDLVLARALNVSNKQLGIVAKFLDRYEGPYLVNEKYDRGAYSLVYVNNKDKIRGVFHGSMLKPYNVL